MYMDTHAPVYTYRSSCSIMAFQSTFYGFWHKNVVLHFSSCSGGCRVKLMEIGRGTKGESSRSSTAVWNRFHWAFRNLSLSVHEKNRFIVCLRQTPYKSDVKSNVSKEILQPRVPFFLQELTMFLSSKQHSIYPALSRDIEQNYLQSNFPTSAGLRSARLY